ncbi:Mpo1 family 2-hydroxy fatty acid dioxygenase [Sphingomonas melonis]|uniref:Putative membrane protein YGL010W n=1 Tax=Sphingomonas melonis TaxID=152682 RepID=A0A7Y9K2C1_9SPHN|nr:Mpo1-like protein [Sphingomonas melonis]NYD90752.1 putative membrane protein YGL010W [Sphingomonas melonis]
MTDLARHLSAYADYHRDERNIATHMVGIPLIVLAIAVLASRPGWTPAEGIVLTPAMLLSAAAALFYLRLDRRFGLVMAALLALGCWAGVAIAGLPNAAWLALGIGGFVAGWAFQFLGHYYEGRKPAFVDDLSGLIVGPLFVVAELAFLAGLRLEVKRSMAAPAT